MITSILVGRCLHNYANTAVVHTTGHEGVVQTDVDVQGEEQFHYPG